MSNPFFSLKEFGMSKKSILAAIFLILIGILFGAILVSSFRSGMPVELGFAGDPQVKLGAPSQIKNPDYDPKALSRAFIQVSKAVTPTVVSITVTTKAKGGKSGGGDMNDFFHFFGPDLKIPDQEPQQGSGSGVIISHDGYILTNNHVVEDADERYVDVVFNDNKHELKAKIIGTDPTTDLAVIKVDGKELPAATFGNSDELEIGEWVVAIGNPLCLQGTVTAGIVSATGRNIGIIRDAKNYGRANFIQTDPAINPGNSGGPLVNLKGEVVGINAAIATTNARYQGYGFAIPINLAQSVAEDIIKHGKVSRGYIGVEIGQVDETLAKAIGLENAGGVIVQNIVAGGAAEKAGLAKGDVILSVDGKPTNAPNELQSHVAQKHPGDKVTLKVFREGKTSEKIVTLRARNDETVAAKNDDQDSEEKENDHKSYAKSMAFDNLGISVRPIASDEKKEFAVERGVVVSDVKRFSEAYNRSLTKGDVILEADKREIGTPKDLKAAIDRHKPGDALLLRVKRGNGQTAFIAVQIPKS